MKLLKAARKKLAQAKKEKVKQDEARQKRAAEKEKRQKEKERLIQALTNAAIDAIGAPRESVRVILREMAPAHFAVGGQSLAAKAAGAKQVKVEEDWSDDS